MNRSFSIVIVRPSPRIRHGEVRAAAIMLRPLARGVQREREQTPASTEMRLSRPLDRDFFQTPSICCRSSDERQHLCRYSTSKGPAARRGRQEDRRVGKASVSTCRSRWSRYNEKKKKTNP